LPPAQSPLLPAIAQSSGILEISSGLRAQSSGFFAQALPAIADRREAKAGLRAHLSTEALAEVENSGVSEIRSGLSAQGSGLFESLFSGLLGFALCPEL